MKKERRKEILDFLKEIDAFKSIERKIYLPHSNRYENDAEHSWHLAMYLILLKEEFSEELDYAKMLEFAIIHDLAELYAGDTFIFDKEALKTKEEREKKALIKLLEKLPPTIRERVEKLTKEYEERKSEESKIVYSIDKLQPMVQNLLSQGRDWKEHKITYTKIDANKRPRILNPIIKELYEDVMEEARKHDFFFKDEKKEKRKEGEEKK